MSLKKNTIQKICTVCKSAFVIPICRDWRENECSSECKKEKRRILKEEKKKNCMTCGVVFYPRLVQIVNGHGNYCSVKCFHDGYERKERSKESRKKSSEAIKSSEKFQATIKRGLEKPNALEISIRGGYRWIFNSEGKKVAEHKYLIELIIGRKLTKNEVVHHKDRNKLNNDIDNLQLMTRSEHTKEHANDENRKPIKGRKITDEHIEKLRKANKGRRFSKESIEKRIESRKRNKEQKLLNNIAHHG